MTAHFPHPVLELIKARLREGSQPGRRRDNAVLALVVEGGGMRGAVSAGGLQALHDLQMRYVVALLIYPVERSCVVLSSGGGGGSDGDTPKG